MERLEKEYEFLCKKINHNPNSKKGLDIVNHFTKEERYNTKGNKGISFNEFQANWDTMYSLIQSNKNMYAWYKKNRPTITEENILITASLQSEFSRMLAHLNLDLSSYFLKKQINTQ